jgi:short-subunit dehydrogenase
MNEKNAIVIGASSGIGRELAKTLSRHGYGVGILARRMELLSELAKELPGRSFVRRIDIANHDEAARILDDLIREMGEVDIIIVNAGVGFLNPDLEWQKEKDTVHVNVLGFMSMANVAMKHFLKRGKGHLVGISSIAAISSTPAAPAYGASKAFMSNYLKALRIKGLATGLPITITDIQPGYIDTAMAQGEGVFWVASAQKAAQQIYKAIKKRRPRAYITRRWRLIAWLSKLAPDRMLAMSFKPKRGHSK